MSAIIKKIEIEQKFAEFVHKDFKSKRYGITPCCYTNLRDIKIKKDLSDWQELNNYEPIGIVGLSLSPLVYNTCSNPNCNCADGSCDIECN